jgi:hypothetical protein
MNAQPVASNETSMACSKPHSLTGTVERMLDVVGSNRTTWVPTVQTVPSGATSTEYPADNSGTMQEEKDMAASGFGAEATRIELAIRPAAMRTDVPTAPYSSLPRPAV